MSINHLINYLTDNLKELKKFIDYDKIQILVRNTLDPSILIEEYGRCLVWTAEEGFFFNFRCTDRTGQIEIHPLKQRIYCGNVMHRLLTLTGRIATKFGIQEYVATLKDDFSIVIETVLGSEMLTVTLENNDFYCFCKTTNMEIDNFFGDIRPIDLGLKLNEDARKVDNGPIGD